jgi:hypothetical protein
MTNGWGVRHKKKAATRAGKARKKAVAKEVKKAVKRRKKK